MMVAAEPPVCRVRFEMEPTSCGTLFAGGGGALTVAVKSCVAVKPSGSLAVTMILPVVPTPTGVTVTVLPEMLTVTTEGLGEFTE